MNFVKSLVGGLGLLVSLVLPSVAAEKTIIVFDASGSMWAQIDGKSRMEIARETIGNVLAAMPVDRELGLMVYGHREKGSCTDIELVVPPAAGTADAISAAVNKISPKGKTPLSAAVKQAAEALKYTEEKATVILITDGLETCNADPCALGNELEKSGVDFTTHVVGFALTEDEGKKVSCLATNTGGKYIQASDAKTLTEALKTTVVAAPEPVLEPAPAPEPAPTPEPEKIKYNFVPTTSMSEDGDLLPENLDNKYEIYKIASDGTKGERVTTEYHAFKGTIEPGNYIVVAGLGEASTEQPVTIEADKVAEPFFILNAGTIDISPYPSQGADVSDQASVRVDYPGGHATAYGPSKFYVPAGPQKITVTLGSAVVEENITLAAGATYKKDIIAGTGHVIINAYYVDDMRVDSGNLSIQVLKAAKNIDGSRVKVEHTYGPNSKFDLPAGDYTVLSEIDGVTVETPLTVKVADQTDFKINIHAGILAVKSPLYETCKVLSPKPNIEGNSQKFAHTYDPEWQTTLAEGDYLIVCTKPDKGGDKTTPVTIKAGERMELTIE